MGRGDRGNPTHRHYGERGEGRGVIQHTGTMGRGDRGNVQLVNSEKYRMVGNFHEVLIFAFFTSQKLFTKIKTAKF